jgi:putative endonuclease
LAEVLDNARHRVRLRRWDREHAWGRRAEDLAHRYLEREGLTVVSRNYARRGGRGELDLVAWEGDILVFVEVKARSTEQFHTAESAVDAEKRRHLVLTASEYLRRTRIPWEKARFDVVTVVAEGRPVIRHIRDAFRPR